MKSLYYFDTQFYALIVCSACMQNSCLVGGLNLVEKGFNSDISVSGLTYHVQTEDWGSVNPFLVSQVFYNGAVLKSIKTAYSDVLPKGPDSDGKSIRLAMRIQHQKILDLLASGQFL